MDIYGLFLGSTGLKYVYLPPVFPLGNRKNTLIKNPKLRDMIVQSKKAGFGAEGEI